MTTSSPQTICWQGSTDYSSTCVPDLSTITLTNFGSCHTVSTLNISTLNNGCYTVPNNYTYTSPQISTLSTASISSIGIDTSNFTINLPEEWVNCFPDFKRIEKMCEEYPGLKIAYEKFKTVYKLVKDHYDTPEDQRPRP
jgi:hypothetical protein